MKDIRMPFRSFALSALWALSAAVLLHAAAYTVSVTAPREIGEDDDLVITMTTANLSDDLGWIDDRLEIDLRDAAGKAVPDSAHIARAKRGVAVDQMIRPFSAHSEKIDHINLSDRFDISGPGTYTVTVSRSGITSAPVVVTILPVVHNAATLAAAEPTVSETQARAVAAIASSGPRQRDLSLRIEADRVSVFAGAEIHLHAILANHSRETIQAPFETFGSVFGAEVWGPCGEIVPESELTRSRRAFYADPANPTPSYPLLGGSDMSAEVELSRLADMKLPGTYSVQLYLKLPENLGGGEIRSNLVLLTVKPRQAP